MRFHCMTFTRPYGARSQTNTNPKTGARGGLMGQLSHPSFIHYTLLSRVALVILKALRGGCCENSEISAGIRRSRGRWSPHSDADPP
jgi:hypothetical protein